MKRLLEMTRADRLAIVGIGLTILIFVATEGIPRFDDPQQLVKYKVLLCGIVLAVILYLSCRLIWILKDRFTYYRDDFNLRHATMSRQTVLSEIHNDDGDLKWEKEVNLRVFRDNVPVRRSSKHSITLETKHNGFNPRAIIIDSDKKIFLDVVVTNNGAEIDVDGVPNYHYEWYYKFRQPLKNKGAFVKYSYKFDLPGAEARAFSHGAVFFFVQDIEYIPTNGTLLAPPGYKIEIESHYMLDCDDVRQELPPDAQPQLDADGKKLTWAFPYFKASKLHCHYKLLPE